MLIWLDELIELYLLVVAARATGFGFLPCSSLVSPLDCGLPEGQVGSFCLPCTVLVIHTDMSGTQVVLNR